MKAGRIARLYTEPGPFATAYVEVSKEQEDGDDVAGLSAQAAADQLADQGAPEAVVELVHDRLSQLTHLPAPVSRFVVANEHRLPVTQLMEAKLAELEGGAEPSDGSSTALVPEAALPPSAPRQTNQTTEAPTINPPRRAIRPTRDSRGVSTRRPRSRPRSRAG